MLPRLKAERTRFQRERQHHAQEANRLVTAIAAADKSLASATERVGQLEESVAIIDRRLREIDSESHSIGQSTIDPDHVAATLAECNERWDVFYPQEKTWIVHLLVERVVYGGDGYGVRVVFRPPGFWTLAPDPGRVSSVSH